MKNSYKTNYLKIYINEGLSVLLGILSLLVVVPYISGNKDIYGVYSLCVSALVFLTYADLGFLGAAQKFAAEYYRLGKRKDEVEVLAFGSFIIFLVSLFLSSFYLLLSFKPGMIINGIEESPYIGTAKSLFLWMAVLAPFISLNRLVGCIYTIRVESYINQFINIIGSILRILSVFYFFTGGRYDVVSYFVFIQIVPIICSIVSIIVAKNRYSYSLRFLIRSFRWNKRCYNVTKDLALSTFASTISMILIYELDQIFIGKIFGASLVALYAIAFAILNYIRMFLGGLYSPFTARFAHFRAVNDLDGLKKFYTTVVNITCPIVLCPLLAVCILGERFVMAWSGPVYLNAVPLTRLFVLFNIFAYFSYPNGSIVTVYEKTRVIKTMSLIEPIVYWLGVLFLVKTLPLISFGIMKDVAFWLGVFVNLLVTFRLLHIDWKVFIGKMIRYNCLSILVVCVLSLLANNYIHIEGKSLVSFSMVCIVILSISIIGYSVSYISNPLVNNYIRSLVKGIVKKDKIQ